MLNVVILSVVMLSVVMLSVVMLSVVAPDKTAGLIAIDSTTSRSILRLKSHKLLREGERGGEKREREGDRGERREKEDGEREGGHPTRRALLMMEIKPRVLLC